MSRLQQWLLGLSIISPLCACTPSSPELNVRHSLEQQQRYKSLNALITVDPDGAMQAAKKLAELKPAERGALHGVTMVVKDNIHVAGLTNTAGTPALANFIPNQDAEVVTRLKAAGAIIIGKANLHELAYGITSNNYFSGAVGNPHQPEYFAGGSSGGTAAAIAAGIVTMGLGTDTGGSSRIPAALTGIVGFRPSTGRYPNQGLTLISNTRDTVGPMALSVADVALLDSVLAADASPLNKLQPQNLRLGVAREYFYQDLEPAVAEAMEIALAQLQAAGVELVEVNLEGLAELNNKVSFPVVLHETRLQLSAYLKKYQPQTSPENLLQQVASPDVKAVLGDAFAGAITDTVYQQAISKFRPQLQRAYAEYFSAHRLDAMVFPTTPLTARKIIGSESEVELNGRKLPTFQAYIRNADPSSNAGIPGISLPIGKNSKGLPIGLELDGPAGSDRRLLAIAVAVEEILNSAAP